MDFFGFKGFKHLPVPPLDDTSAAALARLDGPQEGQCRPHPESSSSSSSSSSTLTLFCIIYGNLPNFYWRTTASTIRFLWPSSRDFPQQKRASQNYKFLKIISVYVRNRNMSPLKAFNQRPYFFGICEAKPISKPLTPTLPIFIQPSLTDCDGFFNGKQQRPTRLPKVDGRKELRPRAPSREWMDIENNKLILSVTQFT